MAGTIGRCTLLRAQTMILEKIHRCRDQHPVQDRPNFPGRSRLRAGTRKEGGSI